jgi:hypothetical protein
MIPIYSNFLILYGVYALVLLFLVYQFWKTGSLAPQINLVFFTIYTLYFFWDLIAEYALSRPEIWISEYIGYFFLIIHLCLFLLYKLIHFVVRHIKSSKLNKL